MPSAKQHPIVVLVPVKNEEWILHRFLSVCEQFAELIIIADQHSTDRSVEICQQYKKVVVIQNKDQAYDEASRQLLLIEKARELIPGPKILLAIDADEILAANAMETRGWQTMLHADPGTVLRFEKPDLCLTAHSCTRWPNTWPLAYVDDGAPHKPRKVHSIRIPQPDYAKYLDVWEVKFLHYASIRPDAQKAKFRFYAALENTLGTKPLRHRRAFYQPRKALTPGGKLEPAPEEWFTRWEQLGIDMRSIESSVFAWHDIEVLRMIAKHGAKRFWMDPIWEFDWERARQFAIAQGLEGIPTAPVARPPVSYQFAVRLYDMAMRRLRR